VKLVLDTNVLLAAILAPGLCRELVRKRCRAHVLCASPVLVAELADKLRRKFGADPADVPLYVAYRQRVQLVEAPPLAVRVCRDADDDMVLATALAAQADIIVTGDDDLLVLESFQGIRILAPRQFMALDST
jgi:putative PIN family toxin of toxin-antitoxin system